MSKAPPWARSSEWETGQTAPAISFAILSEPVHAERVDVNAVGTTWTVAQFVRTTSREHLREAPDRAPPG